LLEQTKGAFEVVIGLMVPALLLSFVAQQGQLESVKGDESFQILGESLPERAYYAIVSNARCTQVLCGLDAKRQAKPSTPSPTVRQT